MRSDRRKGENSNNIGDRLLASVPPELDTLDIQIIDELLTDANITSTAIASKYKIPLSTVQRRRAMLESMSVLKHEYSLDPFGFGLRPVQFWVMIEGGKAEEVATDILKSYNNVLEVTIQMNALSNVGVLAYFDCSEKMFRMLEELKSMRFVNRVEFAEIIKAMGDRSVNFFRKKGQNSLQ